MENPLQLKILSTDLYSIFSVYQCHYCIENSLHLVNGSYIVVVAVIAVVWLVVLVGWLVIIIVSVLMVIYFNLPKKKRNREPFNHNTGILWFRGHMMMKILHQHRDTMTPTL